MLFSAACAESPPLCYVAAIIAPTCTEKGCNAHTCFRCSNSYSDNEVAALGHRWDEGKVTKEPTVKAKGEKTFTCTICGATRTEPIDKLEPMDNPFDDVDEDDYFFDSVLWAVGQEITNDTFPTTFSPDDFCTRGQIVTFLYRQLAN